MSDVQHAAKELAVQPTMNGSIVVAEPQGIGGWLLVVAFGLVVGPIRAAVALWLEYTNPEYRDFFEQYAVAMYGEVVMNLGLVLLMASSSVLFFRKSRYFPRVFICGLIAICVLPILTTAWMVLALSIHTGEPASDFFFVEPLEVFQIGLAVISALIWIPYTLKSRRIKNTFVR